MIPTRRLVTLLFVLALPASVAGFFPGWWAVVGSVDLLALALAAVDLALARRMRLDVRRIVPSHPSIGVLHHVQIAIVHRGRRGVDVRVRDDVPETFNPSVDSLTVRVPPQTESRLKYQITPQRRGRFSFGDIAVRIRGPLGLGEVERSFPAAASISVYPDLRGARRLLLADGAVDLANLGLRRMRRDGDGTEFSRLRDYTQGDSLRDIAWKATARRARPVTRVLEAERSQSVLIAVDAGRTMAAAAGPLSKLDHAINAALFLAFVALRNGDRVGVVVFADGVKSFLPPAAGRGQFRRILEALFATTASRTWVDYQALAREVSVRCPRRSLVCVFTDFIDGEQARGLIAPVRFLAQRHVPVCVAMKDVTIEALLARAPTDTLEPFAQAAAAELLDERATVARELKDHGAHVIDAAPDALALGAVNQYLELKSRGAL